MPRVLLIDDEEDFLKVFGDWLKFKGYDVQIAHDGLEGLMKLRSERFDLVFVDLMMPNMDGEEFCREVRKDENLQATRIIIMTALTRSIAPIDVKAYQISAYMEKIIDAQEIQSTIDKVLRGEIVDKKTSWNSQSYSLH